MIQARLSFSALLAALPALLVMHVANADENTSQLRAELEALKLDYETRIQALELRLNAAEESLKEAPRQPVVAEEPTAAPADNRYSATGNEFNPAIGVILNGALRTYSNDPDDAYIPGFPAGGEAGFADEGLSIGESELVFSSNVDDWFYARLTAAVEQEDNEFSTNLEEAFVETLSLPANTTLRFGRFYSAIGYLNDKHSHNWDFADQALPYSAFLGVQYDDDGVQLRWLAPTDLYVELGTEVFSGGSYPAAGDADSGFGTKTLFAHIGGDVGISNSWSAGLSWLGASAQDRDSGDPDDPVQFSGDTDVYIADFIWKWAPNGNIVDRNLIFQTEYLWNRENGTYLLSGANGDTNANGDSTGWYAQLIYQWRPRWRAGARIDGLSLDSAEPQFTGTVLDPLGTNPLRYTVMSDYSNSEFSRIRLQYARDETGLEADDQFTLQYIMSIGAHGAHEF